MILIIFIFLIFIFLLFKYVTKYGLFFFIHQDPVKRQTMPIFEQREFNMQIIN